MIIIAGYTLTEVQNRNQAVAAHAEMLARARRCDGCIDIAISADAIDAERINTFELWRDQAALDAWRKIANPPKLERRETRVKLYRTDKAESPF